MMLNHILLLLTALKSGVYTQLEICVGLRGFLRAAISTALCNDLKELPRITLCSHLLLYCGWQNGDIIAVSSVVFRSQANINGFICMCGLFWTQSITFCLCRWFIRSYFLNLQARLALLRLNEIKRKYLQRISLLWNFCLLLKKAGCYAKFSHRQSNESL